MELSELKMELSIKCMELEQALDAGIPHSELINIYRELKELHYQLTIAQVTVLPRPIRTTV